MKTTLFSFIFVLISISGESFSQDFMSIKKLTSSDPDSAILVLETLLNANDDSTKMIANQLTGNSYYFKGDYDAAIYYYQKSNSWLDSSTVEGKRSMAKNFNNIGVAYNYQMQLENAYENHRNAMLLREKLNDPYITSSYNNLGLILHDLGHIEEAKVYYLKAFDTKIQWKQFDKLSTTTRNIARVHSKLGQLDSAIYYLEKNLFHLDTIANKRERASTLTNLSFNYNENGDFGRSIQYGKMAFRLKAEIGDNYGLINSALNVSRALRELGDLTQALTYLDSLELLITDIEKYSAAWRVYNSRAYINRELGNDKSAYDYLLKSVDFQDSLSEVNNKKALLEVETKYQTEQRKAEIVQLTADNKIKDLQAQQDAQTRLILFIVLIALLVIAILFYSRVRNKTKTNALLDAKNQELANLNKTKDRLFSIISHDLKSPLSSFHLITKSLSDNLDSLDKSQLKEYLESLRDSSANVRDMMDNLLKWALTQTDQLGSKVEEVELNSVLNWVVNQLDVVSSAKSIAIQKNLKHDVKLLGDASFLEIIIRNLLSNSLKFTEAGKSVFIETDEQADKAIIRLRDEGVGMDQEEIDKLLSGEILGSEIQNSTEKGTGLGITLVKELVKKMDGKLSVQSEKGRGTTFELTFSKAA